MLAQLILRMDAMGSGKFGASRSKGHDHQGTDYVVKVGEHVKAPENGTLVRVAKPYANDSRYSGFVFKGDSGLEYKVFYVAPIITLLGKRVTKGTTIAIAQDVSKKYNPAKMKPHIHVEIRKGNKLLDPYTILKAVDSGKGFLGLLLLGVGLTAAFVIANNSDDKKQIK